MKDYSDKYRDDILGVLGNLSGDGDIDTVIDAASPEWAEYDELVDGINNFRCQVREFWVELKDGYLNGSIKSGMENVFSMATSADTEYAGGMTEYANTAMIELNSIQALTEIMEGSCESFYENNGGSDLFDLYKNLLMNTDAYRTKQEELVKMRIKSLGCDDEEAQSIYDRLYMLGFSGNEIISMINGCVNDNDKMMLKSMFKGDYITAFHTDFDSISDEFKLVLYSYQALVIDNNEEMQNLMNGILNQDELHSQYNGDTHVTDYLGFFYAYSYIQLTALENAMLSDSYKYSDEGYKKLIDLHTQYEKNACIWMTMYDFVTSDDVLLQYGDRDYFDGKVSLQMSDYNYDNSKFTLGYYANMIDSNGNMQKVQKRLNISETEGSNYYITLEMEKGYSTVQHDMEESDTKKNIIIKKETAISTAIIKMGIKAMELIPQLSEVGGLLDDTMTFSEGVSTSTAVNGLGSTIGAGIGYYRNSLCSRLQAVYGDESKDEIYKKTSTNSGLNNNIEKTNRVSNILGVIMAGAESIAGESDSINNCYQELDNIGKKSLFEKFYSYEGMSVGGYEHEDLINKQVEITDYSDDTYDTSTLGIHDTRIIRNLSIANQYGVFALTDEYSTEEIEKIKASCINAIKDIQDNGAKSSYHNFYNDNFNPDVVYLLLCGSDCDEIKDRNLCIQNVDGNILNMASELIKQIAREMGEIVDCIDLID